MTKLHMLKSEDRDNLTWIWDRLHDVQDVSAEVTLEVRGHTLYLGLKGDKQ